jgi:hypothetical protein
MIAFPGGGHNGLWNADFFEHVTSFIRTNCRERRLIFP